jgi:protein-S-isoprenylcysteine O-methyltransferase Ste14
MPPDRPAEEGQFMQRVLVFAYGVFAYVVFFATFLYAVGFIGNFGVPTTIDGPASGSLIVAVLIDVALLGLFAVQHSVMARRPFKAWLTRFVPEPAERSTYVLFSSLALIALFAAWRPLGGIVWDVESPVGRVLLHGIFASGWLVVLTCTFLINHFDLFGLRQVWLHLRGRPYTPLDFATPGPYRFVRHPLYVGWFLAFWGTPTMSIAHLLFAVATTAYILIAIQLEERDLIDAHPDYATYREQVPMLVPRIGGGEIRVTAKHTPVA